MSALNLRSDWFILVLITVWHQMVRCSLQINTNKKAVLWQTNRTMPL